MLAFVARQNKPGTIRSLAKSIRREQWSTMRDDRRCAFANCLLCIYLNYNGRSVYRLAPLTTYEDHLNASLSGQKTGDPSGNSIDTCNLSRIISSFPFSLSTLYRILFICMPCMNDRGTIERAAFFASLQSSHTERHPINMVTSSRDYSKRVRPNWAIRFTRFSVTQCSLTVSW